MAKKKKVIKKANQTVYYIIGVVLMMLALVSAFQLGVVGQYLTLLSKYLVGDFYYVILGSVIIVSCYILFLRKTKYATLKNITAFIILNVAVILLSATLKADETVGFEVFMKYVHNTSLYFKKELVIFGGGLFGAFFYSITSYLFDKLGTYFLIVAMCSIVGILIIPVETYRKMGKFFSEIFTSKELEEIPSKQEEVIEADSFEDYFKPKEVSNKKSTFITLKEPPKVEEVIEDSVIKEEEVVHKKSVSKDKYKLPPFSLLDPIKGQQGSNANQVAASESGRKVIEILKNFGVNAELVATHIGPSVTKFEIKPDSSVKVSRINAIQDNIKMELAARDIRIEAPIPGKTAVGIEIPNIEAVPVKMLELVKSIPMEKMDQKLLFVLGKDLLGKPVYCQLDKMPHLLIAGATGSGKSVCMNTIITSFLLRCHPDEVKLLLIDPKKVEFTPYQQIPHLIAPVISDAAKASSALKVIVTIMEERFDVFAQCGVRNIKAYNEKVAQDSTGSMQNMPYIVVIIDELADLMSVAGKEVEVSIQRITQLARASGIHLIVATQRPSTDVVTGIIKSNIPSRISFSVASGIDSRTILDQVGAERLLGNGDMLYVPIGEPSMIRLQGVYVTDEEVNRIASYCSDLRKPMYLDNFIKLETLDSDDNGGIVSANEDPLYEEVKEYVIDVQKASTSLLQRRFGIGYNRAARMIDILESNGIIGPVQGSKPREVYIKKEQID